MRFPRRRDLSLYLTRFADAMLADPEAQRRMGERAKAAVKAPESLPHDTARALLELMEGRC